MALAPVMIMIMIKICRNGCAHRCGHPGYPLAGEPWFSRL